MLEARLSTTELTASPTVCIAFFAERFIAVLVLLDEFFIIYAAAPAAAVAAATPATVAVILLFFIAVTSPIDCDFAKI